MNVLTDYEKQFIYDYYSIKGADWCAHKLQKKGHTVMSYATRMRYKILEGKSDLEYDKFVALKKRSNSEASFATRKELDGETTI